MTTADLILNGRCTGLDLVISSDSAYAPSNHWTSMEYNAANAWNVNLKANPFDGNVYWPGQGNAWRIQNRHVKNGAWSAWQAAGQDVHSVVADPLFVDAAHGDYRLKAESPAFARGFKDLPYAEMGLRRTQYRPKLPTEASGLREHPEWLK